MAKRKKRINTSKKKKSDEQDDVPEEEDVPSAKKMAASSTSFTEDDTSQTSMSSGIGTTEISGGALGFTSHFWCNYCEFSADTKPELITHMRQHMIKCSHCTFSSLSRSEVNRHVKNEHSDEVEAETASSSTDQDMDKDPCCACVFCDFLTYSTEYLEKHTKVKHRGMLPKSVAKMITKSVSARIRQADAMFYAGFSSEPAEANNTEKEQDSLKAELPSSSNTIVIDGDHQVEVKPFLKELSKIPSDENYSSQISSCLKPISSEEQAEKIINELSRALTSPIPAPSEWKVKVETMYCLSCPFSNVAIDKLKCHTFARHPAGAAVARNNSSESGFTLPDVTFFCVKASCSHTTNTCSIFEEHLMKCCPLHQPLSEVEKERLRATLKFTLDFGKKHCLKPVPGFIDFVASFNKIHSSEDSLSAPLSNLSSAGNPVTQAVNESISLSQNTGSQNIKSNNLPFVPNVRGQNHPHNSLLQNVAPNTGNQQSAPVSMTAECNDFQSHNSTSAANNFQNSHHSFPSHNISNTHIVKTGLPASNMDVQPTSFPPTSFPPTLSLQQRPQHNQSSHSIVTTPNSFPPVTNNCFPVLSPSGNLDPNHYINPSVNPMQSNPTPSPGNSIPNTFQAQQTQIVESGVMGSVEQFQNDCVTVPSNSGTFVSNQVPYTSGQSIGPNLPHIDSFNSSNQNICGQSSASLISPFNDPPVLSSQHFQQQNASSNLPVPATVPHPQKMLDLLSDSYSVLLDDELDLNSCQSGQKEPLNNIMDPIGLDTSQPAITEIHGATTNQNMPVSSNPNPQEISLQDSQGQSMNLQNSGMPQPIRTHSQSSTNYDSVPPQSTLQNDSVQQASASNILLGPNSQQIATSFDSAVAPAPSSQNVTSLAMSYTGVPTPVCSSVHHANTNSTNLAQSSMTGSQYSSSSSHHFPSAMSGPVIMSSQSQVSDMNVAIPPQVQDQPATIFDGQNPAASSTMVSNSQSNLISQGQNLNISGNSSQNSMPSFLETNNSAEPVQNSEAQQATNYPNFLVSASSTDSFAIDQNHSDSNSFPNQEIQEVQPGHLMQQGVPVMANQMTPMKNQGINHNAAGKTVAAGNSPLSPSIYLNGQAPRHNRSNWTSVDMMPRGSVLPQIRHRASAPVNYPGPHRIRQNLFPPMGYRGRGRPRGSRMPSRFPRPVMNQHDDDVIVTAVVRGPPPAKQLLNRPPLRGAPGRGQRLPIPCGSARGRPIARHPLNPSPLPSQAKTPFDVSRHFVDLACVVNSTNEDDSQNGGEDDIQIMGMTPGQNSSKGPPKVVDAKKFSFCCVHCGKDQGSKQVLKQHMKTNHNDSLLGALRNAETGQLLFFCPQLKCEFMTYDENRLTDHLYSCYSLDKTKQLPFDLHSALKNLRSLKIRKVNTNVSVGGSETNPIDIDGKGLRDTFNNNLTDAFDDMVENTIGRCMTKPTSHTQPFTNTPPQYAQARQPRPMNQQRGRPILSNVRMPRTPQNFPRQAQMPPSPSNQRGNPRMSSYPQPYGMTGGRNFRQSAPPRAMRPPLRGGNVPQMPRPSLRGRPPSQRPPAPLSVFGNEGQPILIDIEPELVSTQSQQTNQAFQNQPSVAIDSTYPSISVMAESRETSETTTTDAADATAYQNMAQSSDLPLDSSLPSTNQDARDQLPYEQTSSDAVCQSTESMESSSTFQNRPLYQGAEDAPQQVINPVTAQSDNTAVQNVPAVSAQDDHSANGQFVPVSEPNNSNAPTEDELLAFESEEEQVNAILLKKVFAKVPHMPKKLSQRLVLRFKEFAAKRGVVITPNSKVIDEFVERITYKGSNPMSKQQQQQIQQQQQVQQQKPQQQFTQQQQQPQQQEQFQQQQPFQPQQQFQQPQQQFQQQQQFPQRHPQQQFQQQQPQQQFQQHQPQQQFQQHQKQQQFQQHQPQQQFQQHQPRQQFQQHQPRQQFQQQQPQPQQQMQRQYQQQNNHPMTVEHSEKSPPNTMDGSHSEIRPMSIGPNTSTLNDSVPVSDSLSAAFETNSVQNQNHTNISSHSNVNSINETHNFQNQNDNLGSGRTHDISNVIEENNDIIETKIILPERNFKFSGAFANVAKSLLDQDKTGKKPELSMSPSSSPSGSASPADVKPVMNYNNSSRNLTKPIASESSSAHVISLANASSYDTSAMPLFEHDPISINEKIMKKEPLPMIFPSTEEGESILVQSSVDHLVSGNARLEVDIAGKPLPSVFPEDSTDADDFPFQSHSPVSPNPLSKADDHRSSVIPSTEQESLKETFLKKEPLPISSPIHQDEEMPILSRIDGLPSDNAKLEFDIAGKLLSSHKFAKEDMNACTKDWEVIQAKNNDITDDVDGKSKPKLVKSQDPVIDKSTGKLLLKVKKADIPRKRRDPCSIVVPKTDDAGSIDEKHSDEQFVRRSERKRKVRQSEANEVEVDEIDALMSDDDDEYHVESDDESYDESSDYTSGHSSSKKRSKQAEDPNAFDIKLKGSFNCWICYRKFTRCLSVKKHILKKHSKAFCAISQENCEEPNSQIQFSLLLFCPKKCKYTTSQSDAFTGHMTTCRKSRLDSEELDFVDVQNSFITQEYVELQQFIATGAISEMLNKHKASSSGKKKKQQQQESTLNLNAPSVGHNDDETVIVADVFDEMNSPL